MKRLTLFLSIKPWIGRGWGGEMGAQLWVVEGGNCHKLFEGENTAGIDDI